MSIALGGLAVALASLAGTPQAKADGREISYQFKVVEIDGLQWRESCGRGLKLVTCRGGVTVWTAPQDFLATLPQGRVKGALTAPRITARPQTTAHFTSRKSQPFVTQVAWRKEGPARRTREMVREGMAATVSGRIIDQGVLAQLVIEDTEIRAVHTLNLPAPATAAGPAAPDAPAACPVALGGTAYMSQVGGEQAVCIAEVISFVSPDSACPASGHCGPAEKDAGAKQAAWSAAAVFARCADNTDKAAQCHAAGSTCETKAETCHGTASRECAQGPCCDNDPSAQVNRHRGGSSAPQEKPVWSPAPARTAQVQVPEIGHGEIAGEWLIPRDEVLLVGFGPHTVADSDGKAVVRERLAVITAEEIEARADAETDTDANTDVEVEPREVPMVVPRVGRPTAATAPASTSIPAPAAPSTPAPPLPSRSLPQGIHADGTPAELPPLPEDEKPEAATGGASSEPRPSPQSKKPQPAVSGAAAPPVKPAPTSDGTAAKAGFTLPRRIFNPGALPQLMIPNLQFMMPLKPFAMKLPLNQRLELELVGRIVPDTLPVVGGSED